MFFYILFGFEYRLCNLWGLLGLLLNFLFIYLFKEFNLYNFSIMYKFFYSIVFLVFSIMLFSFDFVINVRWW